MEITLFDTVDDWLRRDTEQDFRIPRKKLYFILWKKLYFILWMTGYAETVSTLFDTVEKTLFDTVDDWLQNVSFLYPVSKLKL